MSLQSVLDFLHTPYVDKKWVYLDWFSFGHLIFGFVTMLVLFQFSLSIVPDVILFFIVLIAWELFEIFASANHLFYIRRDKLINSIWDLIVGGLGGILFFIVNNKLY